MQAKANALSQGFIRCHDCGYLVKMVNQPPSCPRCDSHLHARHPHSLQRTTALLLSSFLLYIPANIFPIMIVNKFGAGEPSTIAGGIVELIDAVLVKKPIVHVAVCYCHAQVSEVLNALLRCPLRG